MEGASTNWFSFEKRNKDNWTKQNCWTYYRRTMARTTITKKKNANYYRIHYYDRQFHGTKNDLLTVAKKPKWLSYENLHVMLFTLNSFMYLCLCTFTFIHRLEKRAINLKMQCAISDLVYVFPIECFTHHLPTVHSLQTHDCSYFRHNLLPEIMHVQCA